MVGLTERETQVRLLYEIVTIGNNIFEDLQLLKEIKPKIAELIRLVVGRASPRTSRLSQSSSTNV